MKNEGRPKSVLKGIGKMMKAAVLLLGIFLSVDGLLWLKARLFKYRILKSESLINDRSVSIYQVGEPGFPFGKTHCRIEMQVDGKKVLKYNFDIANHGIGADETNFEVEWADAYVRVVAKGEEQLDKYYYLYNDGTMTSEDNITRHKAEMTAKRVMV